LNPSSGLSVIDPLLGEISPSAQSLWSEGRRAYCVLRGP
jgi:hypothetical protein